jgi:hypothetical protein
MSAVLDLLAAIGRRSQLMLVAGLVGGLLWPAAAGFLRPYLTELIIGLLFFAALRVEPGALRYTRSALAHDLAVVGLLQFLLPVLLAGLLAVAGWSGPAATMLILIASASAIAGSPPIAQMLDLSGTLALRLLVTGTLLLPLTSLLPLRMAFGGAGEFELLRPALTLSVIILASSGGAALVRRTLLHRMSVRTDHALGGVTAVLLAIFVLALMDAVQPTILASPLQVAWTLAFTSVIGFGLQIVAALAYRRVFPGFMAFRDAGAVGIVAGNRNTALFLAALPASQMDPLMVLIGCYQIPMFLTPLLMRPFYRWLGSARHG